MEEHQNHTPQIQEDDDLVIDWMGILSKLLKHWKQIVLIGFVFGVIGIISALTMKRYYNVSLTLAPEIQARNGGNLSSVAALLGLGGVQMGSSTDAMSISLFPAICKSTPFLVSLLDVPLASYVSEGQLEQGVKPLQTTVYKHLSEEDVVKKGLAKWRYERAQKKHPEKPYTGVSDPTELTRRQAKVVSALSQSIIADVDKKTGVTTVSVTMDDRMMAKQLADTVCSRLQAYVSDYRTKKATADYDFYSQLAEEARQNLVKAQAAYAASVDYDRSVILQSATAVKERLRNEAALANELYSQMVQQRELARARIQEERPVYAVVQPAVLPQRPINSRAKRVLIWGFIGGLLAVAWYGFGADFFKKMRTDVKERMENEE